MNLSDIKQKSAGGSVVARTANTRLTGSWLIIARVVWLALVIPSIGLCVASLIVSYQQMQTVCVDLVTCNNIAGGDSSTGATSPSFYWNICEWICRIGHYLQRDNRSDLVYGRFPYFLAQV